MFMGFLNLVPYLQTLGFVPMVLLALLKAADTGESFWVIFIPAVIVVCVVQAIQDIVLVPKIMGSAMGLKPAVILLSLSIWGSLLGFVGLIVALPLTTLIVSYYKRYVLEEPEEAPETHQTEES
jgi:predicted PurR-regulated permease PerM